MIYLWTNSEEVLLKPREGALEAFLESLRVKQDSLNQLKRSKIDKNRSKNRLE